jgi:ABC-type microcin C transport system permease subunit YejB
MHEQSELKLPEYVITQYVFHLIVVVLMGHINEFSNTTILDKARVLNEGGNQEQAPPISVHPGAQ